MSGAATGEDKAGALTAPTPTLTPTPTPAAAPPAISVNAGAAPTADPNLQVKDLDDANRIFADFLKKLTPKSAGTLGWEYASGTIVTQDSGSYSAVFTVKSIDSSSANIKATLDASNKNKFTLIAVNSANLDKLLEAAIDVAKKTKGKMNLSRFLTHIEGADETTKQNLIAKLKSSFTGENAANMNLVSGDSTDKLNQMINPIPSAAAAAGSGASVPQMMQPAPPAGASAGDPTRADSAASSGRGASVVPRPADLPIVPTGGRLSTEAKAEPAQQTPSSP